MKTYLLVALTTTITLTGALTKISSAHAATEANSRQLPSSNLDYDLSGATSGEFSGQTKEIVQGKSSSSQTAILQEGPTLTVPSDEPEVQPEVPSDQSEFTFELPGGGIEIPELGTPDQSLPIVDTASNQPEASPPDTPDQSLPIVDTANNWSEPVSESSQKKVASIPEPSTTLSLLLGVGLGFCLSRKRLGDADNS